MSKEEIEEIKEGVDDLLFTINKLCFANENSKPLYFMTTFLNGLKDSLDELVEDE